LPDVPASRRAGVLVDRRAARQTESIQFGEFMLQTAMARKLKSLWAGEVPLPETFWWYAVAYGVPLNFVTSGLFLALIVEKASAWVLAAAFLLPVPYNVFATVAVWRSAGRWEGERKWADLARVATVLGMIVLTLL